MCHPEIVCDEVAEAEMATGEATFELFAGLPTVTVTPVTVTLTLDWQVAQEESVAFTAIA